MNGLGLVLEGGGMRGIYTAGVLEYFMENDIYVPYVIGVSAGACMGASYLSRQPGRNRTVNLDFLHDKRYLSYSNYLKNRELFGMDFIFDEIPNRIVPFDVKTLINSPEEFVIGATDCVSGEAVYFKKKDYDEVLISKLLRATSSLPFVAHAVEHDGKMLLDGGIVTPLPLGKSIDDGNDSNIVILTKPRGYRKRPSRMSKIIHYKKYPKVDMKLKERYKHYNKDLEFIYAKEKEGKAFVFAPSQDLKISRTEKSKDKLEKLYRLGYQDAKAQGSKLKQFISQAADTTLE
jgi:predicted patatin/cPLA2 family phospholipase